MYMYKYIFTCIIDLLYVLLSFFFSRTHGLGFQKKKLSASTNNLSEDPHGRKDQIVSKLQTQLNRVFKEKVSQLVMKYCASLMPRLPCMEIWA